METVPELSREDLLETLRHCSRFENYSCHGCQFLENDKVCMCDNFVEIPQVFIHTAIELLEALMAAKSAESIEYE